MTAEEKRQLVADAYSEILGRNYYSQTLRDYCYQPCADGNYYSDCSSSVSYAYQKAGFSYGILTTVGMYTSSKFARVGVTISNGAPVETDRLRIGDLFLFAGTDTSRAYAGYVGHVEMVYSIRSGKVTLCGHGELHPSLKDMEEYCRKRYASRTNTPVGNKGLIKVIRFIQDDEPPAAPSRASPGHSSSSPAPESPKLPRDWVTITGANVNLRAGPGTEYPVTATARSGTGFLSLGVSPNGWYALWEAGRGVTLWVSPQMVARNSA